MRVALEQRAGRLDRVSALWRTCRPFVENARGVLIHRPRSVTTYHVHRNAHTAIAYWCGATAQVTRFVSFIDEPPVDALLCTACETRAVNIGLPPASELVGRHVHLGRVVGIRTCCKPAEGGKHE